jgi:DNA-binding protein HU-beta
MAFGKTQLVDKVAESAGVSKKTAGGVIDSVFSGIMNALDAEGAVSIIGFGTFKVVDRAARSGRNPGTGAAITIPAHKAVRFSVGKKLKEMVNKQGKKKAAPKKAKAAPKTMKKK